MSKLAELIIQNLITAQKNRQEVAVSTLRFLMSSVKNAEIEKRSELTDDEIGAQIQKDDKRHKESIEAFKKAGRDDLVGKESAELEILQKYLPAQMSSFDVEKIVDDVIAASGASTVADMGKVMGQVMGKVGSGADGGLVSEMVKKKLSS